MGGVPKILVLFFGFFVYFGVVFSSPKFEGWVIGIFFGKIGDVKNFGGFFGFYAHFRVFFYCSNTHWVSSS